MTRKLILLAFVGFCALTACDDAEEPKLVQNQEGAQQAEEARKSTPVIPVIENVDLFTMNGRWVSNYGDAGENARLLIDIANDGSFSMEVRQKTNDSGKEAVIEMTTGKAVVENNTLIGTSASGDGVHMTLEKYKSWTLDGSGSIKSPEAEKAIAMTKE